MALHWIIDSKQQLIDATIEGEFAAQDMRDYLAAIVGADVLRYRQLLDFSRAVAKFTPEETLDVGVQIRLSHGQSTIGPLAIVLPVQQPGSLARLFGILAIAPRPLRLFHKRETAVKWLDSLGTPIVIQRVGPPTAGASAAAT